MSLHLHQLRRSGIVRFFLALFVVCVAAKIIFGLPTISLARHKAVQTKTNLSGLLQAIEGFYSTYSTLPKSALRDGEITLDGEPGTALLTILLGKEDPAKPMENTKQIRFLNTEETKIRKKGGLLYSGDHSDAIPVGLYDSWGNPLHVLFDSNLDQEIQDPFQPDKRIRNKIAIVFSYGPDGKPSGGDDIKTW